MREIRRSKDEKTNEWQDFNQRDSTSWAVNERLAAVDEVAVHLAVVEGVVAAQVEPVEEPVRPERD